MTKQRARVDRVSADRVLHTVSRAAFRSGIWDQNIFNVQAIAGELLGESRLVIGNWPDSPLFKLDLQRAANGTLATYRLHCVHRVECPVRARIEHDRPNWRRLVCVQTVWGVHSAIAPVRTGRLE